MSREIHVRSVAVLAVTALLVAAVAAAGWQSSTNAGVASDSGAIDGYCVRGARCLPSISTIDAHTNITVFLRDSVPAEMRIAALRRAWVIDPSVRDFKALQENDWNFNDPDGVPGFGVLGENIDLARMVARVFGDSEGLEARALQRSKTALRVP